MERRWRAKKLQGPNHNMPAEMEQREPLQSAPDLGKDQSELSHRRIGDRCLGIDRGAADHRSVNRGQDSNYGYGRSRRGAGRLDQWL
jgi:hypothetical protein